MREVYPWISVKINSRILLLYLTISFGTQRGVALNDTLPVQSSSTEKLITTTSQAIQAEIQKSIPEIQLQTLWSAINAQPSEKMEVTCKVSEIEPLSKVMWTPTNSRTALSRSCYFDSKKDATCTISVEPPLLPEDQGEYTCHFIDPRNKTLATKSFNFTLYDEERRNQLNYSVVQEKVQVEVNRDASWVIYVESFTPEVHMDYKSKSYSWEDVVIDTECLKIDEGRHRCVAFMRQVKPTAGSSHTFYVYNEYAVKEVDLQVDVIPVFKITIEGVPEVYPAGLVTQPKCNMTGLNLTMRHTILNYYLWEEMLTYVECDDDVLTSSCNRYIPIENLTNGVKKSKGLGFVTLSILDFAPVRSGYLICSLPKGKSDVKNEERICLSDGPVALQSSKSEFIEGELKSISCEMSHCNYNRSAGIRWFYQKPGDNNHTEIVYLTKGVHAESGLFSVRSTLDIDNAVKEIYTCEAIPLNKGVRSAKIQVEGKDVTPMFYIAGLGTASGLALVFVGIAGYYKWRRWQEKKNRNLVELLNLREGDLPRLNDKMPIHEQAPLLPFDSKWEFPRSKLVLGAQLGAGFFGVVVKAEATGIVPGEEKTSVAVKMAKRFASTEVLTALVGELKIMSHLGRHPHIVNLLGAVVDKLGENELMIIVELCACGSLIDYLTQNKHRFVDLTEKNAKASSTPGPRPNNLNLNRYINVQNSNLYEENDNSTEECLPFNTEVLIQWSFQIARGMEYLASKRILHGDLAARNVLLTKDNTAKISDFGLSRSMYYDYEREKDVNAKLPVKWMAIESLEERKFSMKSDVWAYGVTIWEVFSMGLTPYAAFESFREVWSALLDGYRLPKPVSAPEDIYKILLKCWNADPEARPSFSDLSCQLFLLIDEDTREHYLEMEDMFKKSNATAFSNTSYILQSHTGYVNLRTLLANPPPPSEYLKPLSADYSNVNKGEDTKIASDYLKPLSNDYSNVQNAKPNLKKPTSPSDEYLTPLANSYTNVNESKPNAKSSECPATSTEYLTPLPNSYSNITSTQPRNERASSPSNNHLKPLTINNHYSAEVTRHQNEYSPMLASNQLGKGKTKHKTTYI